MGPQEGECDQQTVTWRHHSPQVREWDEQAVAAGDSVTHCFMMRHPAKAVSSLYYKSCVDNENTGYTHFDPVEAGYEQVAAARPPRPRHAAASPPVTYPRAPRDLPASAAQMGALLADLDARGVPCHIIDADDLLEDPAGIMAGLSEAVGLPFDASMLSWEAGPVKQFTSSPFTGWTEDVQRSTGIKRREKRSPPPSLSTLPADVQETIARAMPIYMAMSARRIRPPAAVEADAADAASVAVPPPVFVEVINYGAEAGPVVSRLRLRPHCYA